MIHWGRWPYSLKCLHFEVRVCRYELDDEAVEVHAGLGRSADRPHRRAEEAPNGRDVGGSVSQARVQARNVLHATVQVWRHGVPYARKLTGLVVKNARLKKLLAESMQDVSTLKKMLAKAGDVRFAAICREPGDEGKGLFAMSWMRVGRVRTEGLFPDARLTTLDSNKGRCKSSTCASGWLRCLECTRPVSRCPIVNLCLGVILP